MSKKTAALALCLVMIFSAFPAVGFADDDISEEPVFDFDLEIPRDDPYMEIPEEFVVNAAYPGNGDITDDYIYANVEDASVSLRSAFRDRAASVTISWIIHPQNGEDINRRIILDAREIYNCSRAHTGDPYEGIYLEFTTHATGAFTASRFDCRSFYIDEYGRTIAVGKFILSYVLTDDEQELFEEMSDDTMEFLDLEGKSEQEKATDVYGYVINHTRYRNNSQGALAYGALVNGLGNCSGTSQLIYHLMLRAGIDCRYIIGYSGSQAQTGVPLHAWNIIKVDGKWYNIDATFDLRGNPTSPYYNTTNVNGVNWLLKCDYTFETDRNGIGHHGHKQGCQYYDSFLRSLTDVQEGRYLFKNTGYLIDIDPGEEILFTFVPEETGAYVFRAFGKDIKLSAIATPYLYSESIVPYEVNETDFVKLGYVLEKGHRYYFSLVSSETSVAGTVNVSIRNDDDYIKIIDGKCEDLYYSCYASPKEKDCEVPSNYDVRPKKMTVVLDDGTLLNGSFDEIMYILNKIYDVDPKYEFIGNDQKESPWGVGEHHMVLVLDHAKIKYRVVIKASSSDPYQKTKIINTKPFSRP